MAPLPEPGADEQVTALLARNPAAHVVSAIRAMSLICWTACAMQEQNKTPLP